MFFFLCIGAGKFSYIDYINQVACSLIRKAACVALGKEPAFAWQCYFWFQNEEEEVGCTKVEYVLVLEVTRCE